MLRIPAKYAAGISAGVALAFVTVIQPLRGEAAGPDHSPLAVATEAVRPDPVSGLAFVRVPAGRFQIGCELTAGECDYAEQPRRSIAIAEFWISRFEVTQGQWQQIMGRNPAFFRKGDAYPVEQVSWNDVQDFLGRLNRRRAGSGFYRLPSEAEWEYACRSGGQAELYCGGNAIDLVAWYGGNADGLSHPVGRKNANGLGIFDMSGNVYEWVEDCWHDDHGLTPSEGRPWRDQTCDYRVLRGGAWNTYPWLARATYRGFTAPDLRAFNVGFRVASTLPP